MVNLLLINKNLLRIYLIKIKILFTIYVKTNLISKNMNILFL